MDWKEAERQYEDEITRVTTIPELFEQSITRYGNKPAHAYKGGIHDRSLADTAFPSVEPETYESLGYTEVGDIVRYLASGFAAMDISPGDRVVICADTRIEWALCDFAVQAIGGVVTTAYPGSSSDQLQYLIEDPAAEHVVVGTTSLLSSVVQSGSVSQLQTIVVMDSLDGFQLNSDVDVFSLEGVYETGREEFDPELYEAWIADVDPQDLATIVYTSGTTGQPKGVKLTHRNLCANISQLRKRMADRPDKSPEAPSVTSGMRSLSFLPLAHIFERLSGHFFTFASGVCVHYAESPETLQQNLPAVQPELLTSVPRVYEKLYSSIQEQASPPVKSRVFEWATDVAKQYQRASSPGVVLRGKYSVAESLVFSDIHDALGGNIELLISGGGTISTELCELYHGMGFNIVEGYGLTEASPVVSVNPPEAVQIGTIGHPLPGVDVSIDTDVVEDGVFDVDGAVGDLLVKGENVTSGYWDMPEVTSELFTDGWLRTGDIVHQRPDGYLEFKEREKQMLVLSTGKNVAPAPIEDSFSTSEFVEQCMVVGDSEKMVSALIVPRFEGIVAWAEEAGVDIPSDPVEMCESDAVRNQIQKEVNWVNIGFEPHETIKEFYLISEGFTEENGLLTPSQKKKRQQIVAEYGHLWK